MSPFTFAARSPGKTLLLSVALIGASSLGFWKFGGGLFPAYSQMTEGGHHAAVTEASHTWHPDEHHAAGSAEHHEHGVHKIIVTSPLAKDVIATQQYVCVIQSCRHIEVRALENGYLENILIKEGQLVNQGETMFKVLPVLYQAKKESEAAEAHLVELKFGYTKKLQEQNMVSPQEVALAQAELAKAQAKLKLAQAELNFTEVKAPFPGIIDRLSKQQGSLVSEGDVLTTLSDNSTMWVYFNVPEKDYLAYKSELDKQNHSVNDYHNPNLEIELVLADHNKFPQPGKIMAIEADSNNATGNIAFRADFPNPNGLLRNGLTGSVLLHRVLKDSIVIPQRATYEILAKRYVFLVGEDHVVHQREIEIAKELDDIFVIKSGVEVKDTIILEGIRQVKDGQKIDCEFRKPEEVLKDLKYHAE